MAILKADELDILSHSADQTKRLGARLGTLLQPGDVICLSGEMGAGKTVFATGIGIGWGAKYPLTSPTFNLVHEHRRDKDKQRLYHLDFYRLEDENEVDGIGFDDVLDGNGPVIFEWPERVQPVLPKHRLWITLRVLEPDRRNFIFEGTNARYQQMITRFREMAFGV